MNDATTQMGVQFGKSAVAAGQDYVEKNVSRPVIPLVIPPLSISVFTIAFPLSPSESRVHIAKVYS